MAPAGFFRQVVLTQLERGATANPSLWGRLAHLLGVPPAPSTAGVPDRFEELVVVVVGALVGLALVLTWGAARPPARSSLERYGAGAVVVTAAGLVWPAAFYYHYAAFLAPFLALPVGVAADVLYAARSRALAVGAVSALVLVGTVHAVRAVQTTDQPGRPDIAWVGPGRARRRLRHYRQPVRPDPGRPVRSPARLQRPGGRRRLHAFVVGGPPGLSGPVTAPSHRRLAGRPAPD
jgi:hypothetical protein